MFCSKCGNKLPENAAFCDKCGAQINKNIGYAESSKQQTGHGETHIPNKKLPPKLGVMAAIVVCCLSAVLIVIIKNHSDASTTVQTGTAGPRTDEVTPDTPLNSMDTDMMQTIDEIDAEAEAELLNMFADAQVGDRVQFGTYEQDGYAGEDYNPYEPITWIVFDREKDKLLLFSEYVLDYQLVGTWKWGSGNHNKEVTWETSPVRTWLNEEFYLNAFSETERSFILQSHLTTPDTEDYWTGRGDQKFITYGGSDTEDYIFLLSYEEANLYFDQYLLKNYLGGIPTEYCQAQGGTAYSETGYTSWALRSAGTPYIWTEEDYSVTNKGYSDGFRTCDCSGYIVKYWDWEDENYGKNFLPAHTIMSSNAESGIRPAVWVQIR